MLKRETLYLDATTTLSPLVKLSRSTTRVQIALILRGRACPGAACTLRFGLGAQTGQLT